GLFDPETGELRGLDSPNRVYALAVPRSDVFVAAGYTWPEGKSVVRGGLATGRRQLQLGSLDGVLRFATLAAGGRRLAAGLNARARVSVWALAPFRQVATARLPADVTALALTPAGDVLAVAHGPEVGWWEVDRGRDGRLEGHTGRVRCVAFGP